MLTYVVVALVIILVPLIIILWSNRDSSSQVTRTPAGQNPKRPNLPTSPAASPKAGHVRGRVKWFNPVKGYGFIQPDTGSPDIFVHISAVERAGLSTLEEGTVIEYQVVQNRGRESAENLRIISR